MRLTKGDVVMPIKEFRKEHIRLVKVLNSVNNERMKQQTELTELKRKLKKTIGN